MTRSDIVISSWLNTIFSGYYPITFFDCICVVWLHKLILTIICVCRRGGLISAAAFLVKFVHPLGRSPISSRRGGSDCLSFLARVEHPVHLLNDCPSTVSKDMSHEVCVDPTNHTWIPIGYPKNVVVAWLTSCAAAVDHFCHPAVLVLGLTRSLIIPQDDCHARFHIQEPRLRLARSFGRGDVIGWLKQLVLKY